ncbi:hypothetical protein HDV00_008647 [Rhizophlyctis rosea]|nr:hypothetical protein HDV00_008647 [Rhizophlyctis rosea]
MPNKLTTLFTPATPSTNSIAPAPPPTSPTISTPTTLYVFNNYKGILGKRSLSITLSDKQTQVYTATFKSCNADLEIFKSSTNTSVATIKSHIWSLRNWDKTDIHFNNGVGDVDLHQDSYWGRKHQLTLGDKVFWWKGHQGKHMSDRDLKLTDESGTVVLATYAAAWYTTNMYKQGKLDILVAGCGQEMVEAIIVSCLAMVEKEEKLRKAAGESLTLLDEHVAASFCFRAVASQSELICLPVLRFRLCAGKGADLGDGIANIVTN